ncbi:metal-binding protein [Clostridiales bacterium PH28_bin88]|nr:metal-binding protein [Clostridiales bacterium PH28_bin88]
MRCATCGVFACRTGKLDKQPQDCPMTGEAAVYREGWEAYQDPEVGNMARASARTEAAGYGRWTRIEEIMEFSRRAGFRRLGLAFCVGLRQEARQIQGVFEGNGFEVVSVVCKTGAVPKEELGLADSEKVRPGDFEAMCNPVTQAKLLNKAKTDLNVLVGLCVGHDTLFIKFSESPVTVLAAKDRVLAHNPLGAIYAGHYFNKKLAAHHLEGSEK